MSDSLLYSDYIATRQRVDLLERVEKNTTYLTLTRTTTQSLTTAGTLINWEDAVRNVGFAWSAGTSITIPQSGYYAIGINATTTTSVSLRAFVNLGTTRIVEMTSEGLNFPNSVFFILRHFAIADDLCIELLPGSGTTLRVVSYDTLNESPFLHIVRVA